MSGAALVAWPILGQADLGPGPLAALVTFATLESALGLCAGCFVSRQLIRWGWIPQDTCEGCNNLRLPTGNAA